MADNLTIMAPRTRAALRVLFIAAALASILGGCGKDSADTKKLTSAVSTTSTTTTTLDGNSVATDAALDGIDDTLADVAAALAEVDTGLAADESDADI